MKLSFKIKIKIRKTTDQAGGYQKMGQMQKTFKN
jgi:hypothetical protein